MITVIGRGNSGTRILAQTLYASGVFLGKSLNDSADTVPPQPMYEACRLIARHVRWHGGLSWGFDQLHDMPIDPVFEELVNEYLKDVLASEQAQKGWKLPETTLAYPWIARMFPKVKYIHIVRDPRDCLRGEHTTDNLRLVNVPYPPTDDKLDQRVASWKYQHEIVNTTPTPECFMSLRYEDLVLDQESTLLRLEEFLEIPLARIVVDKTRVGLWENDPHFLAHLAPLNQHMREYGYV